MSDILVAKQRLPLPELMHRLELGEHAKKSAHCPFHDDKHNSYSTWKNKDGLWSWKCHAGCGQGDEITFLEKYHGISNKEATKLFLEMARVKPNEQTFNWGACVNALRDKDVEQIAKWRGYSVEFVKQLRDKGLIGIHDGLVAFPVHNDGKIAGAHVRKKDGKWFYYPTGIKTAPLVFGALLRGMPVHVFESTWDGLDYMGKTGKRDAIIITRGATNGKLVAGLIPPKSLVYAWKQNDELDKKTGKRPADEWLKDVTAHAKAKVLWVKTHKQFKDLNAWTLLRTKAGATKEELREELCAAVKEAEVICEPPTTYPSRNAEAARDFQEPVENAEAAESQKKPKKGKRSAASELVAFVVEGNEQDPGGRKQVGPFSLFHDPHDRPFARYQAKDHVEIWPVESAKFRKLLARLYYSSTGKIINRNSLSDVVTTLSGLACHDNPEEPTFLRVAPLGEDILIDLCDQRWRVVLVTAEGWRILDESPVAFVRTGSMQALPEPISGGGSIEPLWKILNVTKAQRPLVAAALLNGFHPSGPYFVTNYVGEHGSAKTSAARIHRQLIDPNQNPLRSPSKEENDLFAQAVNNRCVALDNLSHLPLWLSDALCRIATGGSLSKRTLFTDTDETSREIKRPVIINGIEDVATRPDLADRVLQIELETIPKERRKTEKALWCEFENARPVIFTAILAAVLMALRTLPTLKMPPLPRMADAAEWATAGETAFGFKRWAFLEAYQRNLYESLNCLQL
jgi:hypothetical protein